MSDVAIHIGVPKTATSYIQTWLRHNRVRLAEHGVFTPVQPIHAHRLAVEHLEGPPWDTRPDVLEIRRAPLTDALKTFTTAVHSEKTAVTVISSEYFYYGQPAAIASALRHEFGENIDIVVYIRSQGDLILSGHNQDIKRLGKTTSRPKPVYHQLYDWGLLLDAWAREFGKNHLKVISFDVSSRNRSILRDFVDAACPVIAGQFSEHAFEDVATQNESLAADLLEFKRIANTLGKSGIHDYQWLEELVRSGYSGPRFGVSADEATAWYSLYLKSNEYVAREYFGAAPVEEIFPPDPQRMSGVDLEGQLSIDTVAKLLSFAVMRQDSQYKALQRRIRALETQIADLSDQLKRKPAKN
jgi:hypothetical protein